MTATVDGIGAFILARAHEDERAAKGARLGRGEWRLEEHFAFPAGSADENPRWVIDDVGGRPIGHPVDRPVAEHIVRWSPARALAWVAARRALVAVHRPVEGEYRTADGGERPTIDCSECETGGVSDSHPCTTLRLVAAADWLRPDGTVHPDYREEWTP